MEIEEQVLMEIEGQVFHRVDRPGLLPDSSWSTPDQRLKWLAGELHDDIGQRLALLTIELGMLRQHLGDGASDLDETVARLAQDTAELGSEVHRLAKLARAASFRSPQIKIEEAIRGMYDCLARTQSLAVEYEMPPKPLQLRSNVALALLRIGQEAMHNIIKHSHARGVHVLLGDDGGAALLRVVDDGRGFDPTEARSEGMLGLASMIERARAVGGRLTVASAPGCGTRIEVRIPAMSDEPRLRARRIA